MMQAGRDPATSGSGEGTQPRCSSFTLSREDPRLPVMRMQVIGKAGDAFSKPAEPQVP